VFLKMAPRVVASKQDDRHTIRQRPSTAYRQRIATMSGTVYPPRGVDLRFLEWRKGMKTQSQQDAAGMDRRSLFRRVLMAAGFGGIAGFAGGDVLTALGQAGQRGAGTRGTGARGGAAGQGAGARGAAAGTGAARGAAQNETGSSLILLGTQGGPSINLNRSEASSVIVVNGQPYLIDCGYGTLRALVQANITLASVTNVFITHLHDDHTADIPAMLSHKWTGSQNPRATTVHGPYGTAAMVQGAIAFFKANTEIRTVDEGRTVKPEAVFSGKDYDAPKIRELFRDERVTVTAIENDHYPDRAKEKMPYRSFAYRFKMADRSIVFSGDTTYSTRLIELARGADILVCEVMNMTNVQRGGGSAAPVNTASATGESIARHVRETHSTTAEVGRMAAEAKVKTVVLNHLIPGANGRGATEDVYSAGIREHFSGEIIVGRDQLRL
jgi:ribonuclease BN (tRNA processing enzyme)